MQVWLSLSSGHTEEDYTDFTIHCLSSWHIRIDLMKLIWIQSSLVTTTNHKQIAHDYLKFMSNHSGLPKLQVEHACLIEVLKPPHYEIKGGTLNSNLYKKSLKIPPKKWNFHHLSYNKDQNPSQDLNIYGRIQEWNRKYEILKRPISMSHYRL